MDLLKDNGYVPLTERVSIKMASIFAGLTEKFMESTVELTVELNEESHDFMDLLNDKGMVPEASNDNQKLYTLVS